MITILNRARLLAEAVAVGQLVLVPSVAAQHLVQVFRTHTLVFRQCLDDFPVIIVPSQQIRQAFPQFPPAAAELPADRNNPHILITPFMSVPEPYKTVRRLLQVADFLCLFQVLPAHINHIDIGALVAE